MPIAASYAHSREHYWCRTSIVAHGLFSVISLCGRSVGRSNGFVPRQKRPLPAIRYLLFAVHRTLSVSRCPHATSATLSPFSMPFVLLSAFLALSGIALSAQMAWPDSQRVTTADRFVSVSFARSVAHSLDYQTVEITCWIHRILSSRLAALADIQGEIQGAGRLAPLQGGATARISQPWTGRELRTIRLREHSVAEALRQGETCQQ